MALTLKNKRNRFLSLEVSVFQAAVQNASTEKVPPRKMFVPLSVTFSNMKKHGGIS